VVDANNANGHDKCLMYQELNALIEYQMYATVDRRDLPMVMDVKNAQLDSSHQPIMPNNVLDHHVLDNTKFNSQLIQLPVDYVRPANGLNSNQIMPETNVNQDQLPIAEVALPEDQMINTHVRGAQLDKFKIQTMSRDAIPQLALDNTKSDSLSMRAIVVDVKNANGQDTNQTNREPNVF
jgi:hypothetical protein